MIIVTGANGQLGQAIVERLIERMPASQIGVSVRDPDKAVALRERGVRVRKGNFDDAAGLRNAFEGASQVLIISSNSTGGVTVQQHSTAVEAARLAGARRILYTSHMAANPASLFAPMPDHAATEAMLQKSGVAYTSLRNGFYASTVPYLMGRALQTGEIVAPEDGPVSWTTHADLAEAAAIALTREGSLTGLTPPLTGSQAFDLADIAALASEITGRLMKRVVVPIDTWRVGLVSHGVPEAQVKMFTGLYAASHKREFAAVDPTLERLLGRPPITLRDFLAKQLK